MQGNTPSFPSRRFPQDVRRGQPPGPVGISPETTPLLYYLLADFRFDLRNEEVARDAVRAHGELTAILGE